MKVPRNITKARLFFSISVIVLASCQHQAYVMPESERTGDASLCFDRDILPIFLSQCAKSDCHDASEHEKGYVLDSYEHIVKKGIVPGNALGSKVYQSIKGYTEKLMPEDAPPLTTAQIALIERWINAGAIKDSNCNTPCDSNNFAYSTGVRPIIANYCLGCHSGSSPQGNLLLDSYSAVKNAVQTRNLLPCINYASGYAPMPQGIKLSVCQVRQIEKWVAAGMPDN